MLSPMLTLQAQTDRIASIVPLRPPLPSSAARKALRRHLVAGCADAEFARRYRAAQLRAICTERLRSL